MQFHVLSFHVRITKQTRTTTHTEQRKHAMNEQQRKIEPFTRVRHY